MIWSEILCIVLMVVVLFQAAFTKHLLLDSMKTMRSCSETTDMAVALVRRVLDNAFEKTAAPTTTIAPQQRDTEGTGR